MKTQKPPRMGPCPRECDQDPNCPVCSGKPEIDLNDPIECAVCNGSGDLEVSCSCHGKSPQYECSRCGNSGIADGGRCPVCNGTGMVLPEDWAPEDSDLSDYEPDEDPHDYAEDRESRRLMQED